MKGLVTKIDKKKNSVCLRIGMRKYVSFLNLPVDNETDLLGAWVNIETGNKVNGAYRGISFNVIEPPQRDRVLKIILRSIKGQFSFLTHNLIYSLYLLGKTATVKRAMSLKKHKLVDISSDPALMVQEKIIDIYHLAAIYKMMFIPEPSKTLVDMIALHILKEEYNQNRESVPIEELKQKTKGFLLNYFEHSLNFFPDRSKHFVVDGGFAFLKSIFYLRKKAIKKLSQYNTQEIFSSDVQPLEDVGDILKYRYFIVTGKAGAGKTTLVKKIREKVNNVIVCATTGKASKLLGENTSTVHHLLGYGPSGFKVKRLNCKLLVIDEASMLDWRTLYAVLRAADRCVFVGDPEQLSPVKGESVFKKILGIIPSFKLNQTYRFANGDKNCQEIVRTSESGAIGTVKSLYSYLARKGSVQILSPVKGGLLGTNNLNRIISNGRVKGVRVISRKNLYGLDGRLIVSNGQMGVILNAIDKDFFKIKFDDGNVSVLRAGDFEKAYAITVHKAQGSEYDYVIFVIPDIENIREGFIDEEMIKVGMTRARKTTYVVKVVK